MKHFNRILAALLAALMLCGPWTAVAEMEVELEIESQIGSEGIAPETGDNEPEVELELDDGLQLDGVDMPTLDTEIDMECDLLIDEAEARGEESVQSNISYWFPSEIDKNDVLVKYRGDGGDVVIPEGVKKIGDSAFYSCKSLTSVTIPDSVTEIGEHAFYNCDSLTSVTIPSSVTSIGVGSFSDCDLLEAINVSDGNPNFTSINGILYTRDVKTLLQCPGAKISVTIPDSVTEIAEDAFCYCTSLTSVTIPDNVTSIKVHAFSHCFSLTSIIIPDSVTSIEENAFMFCEDLTSVIILAKTIYIDEDAFFGTKFSTFYIISGSDAVEWVEEGKYYSYYSDYSYIWYDYYIIDLNIHTLTLEPEQTYDITVYGFKNSEVVWTTSNTEIAVVDNGMITAKSVGTCVINAQISNGNTFTCNVTVYDPSKLNKTALTLNLGETDTLEVSGLMDRRVTWSSDNKAVATVKNGKITPKKAGKCTITAKLSSRQYLPAKKLTCKLTVKDGAVISDPTLSLPMGSTHTLTITGLAKRKVTWTSSNKKIATIKNGVVTSIKAGKCIITAQIKNGKKLTCKLTVTDPAALSKEKLTISSVDSATIKLTGALKRKVTWSSSNSGVAKINQSENESATIKAVKTGTATITAKIKGGKTLKCVVTVKNPLTIVEDWDDDLDDLSYWEVGLKLINNSNKKIVYVTFDIYQYDNRGQKLQSPYDYYYFNNDIEPHDYWYSSYTVNDDTRSIKLKVREVTFADKTTWRP